MRHNLITFALMLCLFGLTWGAPTNNGYLYKAQPQNSQAVIPQNKPQVGKQGWGFEIIKLDCETKGPTIKESNGQTITITYYDCGEKGQKVPKGPSNPGYLPKKNRSF